MPFKSKAQQAAVMIRLQRNMLRKMPYGTGHGVYKFVLDPKSGKVAAQPTGFDLGDEVHHMTIANSHFRIKKGSHRPRLLAGLSFADKGVDVRGAYVLAPPPDRRHRVRDWIPSSNVDTADRALLDALNSAFAARRRRKK